MTSVGLFERAVLMKRVCLLAAATFLAQAGWSTYLPMQTMWLGGGEKRRRKNYPLFSRYLFAGLRSIDGVRVLARDVPAEERIALATFVVDAPAMTQENVARALSDMFGVCVSGGYHCAHVLHSRAKLDGTVRASPHVFNTADEIDKLVDGVRQIVG